MSHSANVTSILNGTIEAVRSVVPVSFNIGAPEKISQPLIQTALGVLIGMTGDIKGRLIIEGDYNVLGGIGESMFGMPLEGEMLTSFTGELGNMIAGNLCTNLSKSSIIMDITPPTVLEGNMKISGFGNGIKVPVNFEEKGCVFIILMIEQ